MTTKEERINEISRTLQEVVKKQQSTTQLKDDYNVVFTNGRGEEQVSIFKNFDLAMTVIYNQTHSEEIESYCKTFGWHRKDEKC